MLVALVRSGTQHATRCHRKVERKDCETLRPEPCDTEVMPNNRTKALSHCTGRANGHHLYLQIIFFICQITQCLFDKKISLFSCSYLDVYLYTTSVCSVHNSHFNEPLHTSLCLLLFY